MEEVYYFLGRFARREFKIIEGMILENVKKIGMKKELKKGGIFDTLLELFKTQYSRLEYLLYIYEISV